MKLTPGLYRNTENAKVAGVCSGVAEYFGIETWLVRILTVTGFFLLAGSFILVAYVAAWFILDKKPIVLPDDNKTVFAAHNGKGWRNDNPSPSAPVELKTKIWQAGESPKKVLNDISNRFKQAEYRLRHIETYVTSREFQLKREFSRL